MRLLIVGVRWPPETFIQRRISGLVAKGIQVTVAATVRRRLATQFHLPGVSLLRLPHWDDFILLSVTRTAYDAFRLALLDRGSLRTLISREMTKQAGMKEHYSRLRTFIPLALEKPDVVHFEWNSIAIACLPLFDVWECPIVISCRGRQINVQPHVPGYESFRADLALTFRKATVVHCVSEAIRNEAIRYGLDPDKAVVIPPAVDPEFFKPGPAKDQSRAFTIITVGSLIWGKGYEYALIAVRRLLDAGIETVFEIVGDGPDRQRILYTIRDLELEDVVRLHGHLNPDAVRARLQQADVFLLSSLSEGISNAALEGMACGLPIVTTDCGGMREAVTDGIEGFVVPVRDPEAMAQALKTLATDSGLRCYMGKAARERVLQQFSLQSQIDAFIKLYQAVIS